MDKKTARNFSLVINYKRQTVNFRAGFKTDIFVSKYQNGSWINKGLWICKNELVRFFPQLKGSKSVKILASNVPHEGYSKVSHMNEQGSYVDVTINGQIFTVHADRSLTLMIDNLRKKWNVNSLYFKFVRMD